LAWHDEYAGWVTAQPAAAGDVVLARKETPTSYHLAVTIDDAAQGVTDVVRGVDLFEATHVHRLLQALLGLPTPEYHHHPLLIGPDGKRLAKRNGARPLAELRAEGADPAALLAALRAGELPFGVATAGA
jgi:glutamyl-Q tRNA(Asp) synthetase